MEAQLAKVEYASVNLHTPEGLKETALTVREEVFITIEREVAEKILRELPPEKAFYFYADYGRYTGRYARSLEEFAETLETVQADSIRFHPRRGDFQVWIRGLGDEELAEALNRIDEASLSDGELGAEISRAVRDRISELKASLQSKGLIKEKSI
ncbi:MAG: alpha-amylase [Candidatus Bathyarchaeota archaeon B26-1]|nr:MAG: alpha-amylase [Candidatus Bathyarchaeota archaeon B26-1]